MSTSDRDDNLTLMIRFLHVIILIAVSVNTFLASPCHASELPRPGDRYRIVKPIYLYGVYEDLNDKQITPEKATAYLNAVKFAKRAFMAFQCEVPPGTIMIIVREVPKVWYLPFSSDRYIVQLEPDISRGLDVIITLDRELEGSLSGLNPELFKKNDK